MTQAVKLGLIGDNIHSSSAPLLHKMAAAQYGIDLSYDLIIPRNVDWILMERCICSSGRIAWSQCNAAL